MAVFNFRNSGTLCPFEENLQECDQIRVGESGDEVRIREKKSRGGVGRRVSVWRWDPGICSWKLPSYLGEDRRGMERRDDEKL